MRGELAREGQHHHRVDVKLRKLRNTILIAHELLQTIRPKHLVRIDIEGEHDAFTTTLASSPTREVDDIAMPPVNTVEHTEGASAPIDKPKLYSLARTTNLRHE